MSNGKVMLAGMRRICMDFPKVEMSEKVFKAGDRSFVKVGHAGDSVGPTVTFNFGSQAEDLSNDQRFVADQEGWLTLALHDTNWQELQELTEVSYKQVASPELLEELEARKPVPADIF